MSTCSSLVGAAAASRGCVLVAAGCSSVLPEAGSAGGQCGHLPSTATAVLLGHDAPHRGTCTTQRGARSAPGGVGAASYCWLRCGAEQPPQHSPEGSRGVAAWQRAGSAAVPGQRLRGFVRICPGKKSAWEVLGVPCQQCRELGERGSPGKGWGDGEEGKDRGGWERRQERERQGGRGRRGKIRGKRSTRGGEKKDGLGGRETHT